MIISKDSIKIMRQAVLKMLPYEVGYTAMSPEGIKLEKLAKKLSEVDEDFCDYEGVIQYFIKTVDDSQDRQKQLERVFEVIKETL